MQICMDSSNWLKGIANEDAGGTNTSSPLSAEVIPSPRQFSSPLPDRRLRPQHDQPLKCPRCDSSHTKFCYYNNYSLSQPRYFCKTCRRYWTKGGSLRNVPVGGGCRKNKRTNPKKQSTGINMPNHHHHHIPAATALHLSFSGLQLPLPEPSSANFSEWKYGYHGLGLSHHENKFMGSAEGGELGIGAISNGLDLSGLHALHALRFSIGAASSGGVNIPGQEIEPVQGLSLPFLGHDETTEVDVKPAAARTLPVEWHDQPYCCADSSNRETNGYANDTALWGPSTAI